MKLHIKFHEPVEVVIGYFAYHRAMKLFYHKYLRPFVIVILFRESEAHFFIEPQGFFMLCHSIEVHFFKAMFHSKIHCRNCKLISQSPALILFIDVKSFKLAFGSIQSFHSNGPDHRIVLQHTPEADKIFGYVGKCRVSAMRLEDLA